MILQLPFQTVKFVIQWIIGPLTGSALIGLAWLSYFDVILYADLSEQAREIAYLILGFGALLVAIGFFSDSMALFGEIENLETEDEPLVELKNSASKLKSTISILGQMTLWFVAVYLFFAILDGIADHRRAAISQTSPATTESPQN